MSMEFEGRVALVTGAGAGIGRASAQAFAARGASVVVSDIAIDAGEATVALIRDKGGTAMFHRADATIEAEVEALIAATVSAYGRLDFAHNNTGFGFGQGIMMDEEAWDKTVDLCLKAPWLCLKHELPVMKANGGGAIVNTASMAALSYTNVADIAYSAAKAAVLHLTRYAAAACGPDGIRVNSVSPGLTRTAAVDMFLTADQQRDFAAAVQPIARASEPSEIADAVVWLCSSASAMVTGENICVAGGQQAR